MIRYSQVILLIVVLLLSGCLGTGQKSCATDNECLEQAFLKCEKHSGTWEGKWGSFDVDILGKGDNGCSVRVTVPAGTLNISGKSMVCDVPMEESATFDIKNQCEGELVQFFN